MTRTELIEAINRICERLEHKLPDKEYEAGWTETSRVDMLKFFRKLETDVRAGAPIKYVSIGRVLDSFGVDGGDLLEEACRISVALNDRKW